MRQIVGGERRASCFSARKGVVAALARRGADRRSGRRGQGRGGSVAKIAEGRRSGRRAGYPSGRRYWLGFRRAEAIRSLRNLMAAYWRGAAASMSGGQYGRLTLHGRSLPHGIGIYRPTFKRS